MHMTQQHCILGETEMVRVGLNCSIHTRCTYGHVGISTIVFLMFIYIPERESRYKP